MVARGARPAVDRRDAHGSLYINPASAVRVPVQITALRGGHTKLREATVLEFGNTEFAIFLSTLPLEFDGHAFHKPGGVAPQLEWNNAGKKMILVFYSGNRPSVHVPLDSVADFSSDS